MSAAPSPIAAGSLATEDETLATRALVDDRSANRTGEVVVARRLTAGVDESVRPRNS